ncbi:N-acetylmuramoyl-L-alanine amidase family protein [Brevibacillus humidisoli]|uniref:N-acetylmuramoyl-L-alanine amidase n=1 Tax=Brevibacillus humidisoli TaxID=2895522 RepID=UPI001E64914B|nr:N-acetylmuramoyl-L-alanine amidase [Brevibacillus humidisoli]UFJ40926.1 N-acetylmuramoyl-L-alanine amidase family protein [Brevibacillus humidisoli]
MRYVVFTMMILLGVGLLVPGMTAAASGEANAIDLMIQGERVKPDVPPLIQNGRTLVPIRVIAEGLGAEVSWDQNSRTATIKRDQIQLKLQLGSRSAEVNGKQVLLDAPPALKEERMLLPLRFVGEALGATVGWEASTRTVVVNESIALFANGEDLSASLKAYQVEDTLYLPVQKIAEKLGVAPEQSGGFAPTKVIDSTVVAPLSELERLIDRLPGGEVDWDDEQNRLHIKRVSYLEKIAVDEERVTIRTAGSVAPKHFVLAGPHRIVFDLPSTQLSEEMLAELLESQATQLIVQNELAGDAVAEAEERTDKSGQARAASLDETEADRDTSEDEAEASAGDTGPPSWLFDEAERTTFTEQTVSTSEASQQQQNEMDQQPLIREVRYSQFSDSPYTVRVVIELNQKSKYTVTPRENGFEVELTPIPRKTGFLIVVDAGHGAHDPGARGVAGNWEKDFNLAVANRMVELLKEYPEFQPVATRSTDVFLELQERVALANEYEADLFISIHANSFRNAQTGGTETYYYNEFSEAFAKVVHKHLVQATGFPDRKMRQYPFYVIKHTQMPAVLTETGFLSNPTENAQLLKPEFQEKVAKALVAAIREYYESYH